MASTFLENVANYLYQNHRHEFEDSVVVFPGKRAAIFLKKHLGKITGETIWLPSMLSVGDFFREQSSLYILDDLKLLFQLYLIYREETKSEETFDQFYFWGNMLLGDFDDIDKYLVDAGQLFSNVKSLKEIDEKFGGLLPEEIDIIKQFWTSFNPQTSSQHKDEFLRIWKVLYKIYSKFRKKLAEDNCGYEGMVFRQIAEKAKGNTWHDIPWKNVFYVGLNAVTPTEYVIMKSLQKAGKAKFFWDYDNFYLNEINEAGMFLRENIIKFPPPPDFENPVDNLLTISKKISVYSVASNIGQAKNLYLPLSELNKEKSPDATDTCVVLADENLLVPVLYSIPEYIDKINVTMGYPMNGSTVFHFIQLIIELQNAAKISGQENVVFYHKQVMALLNHQYLTFWETDTTQLKNNIVNNNAVYISSKKLKINEYFEYLFSRVEHYKQFSQHLMQLLYELHGRFSKIETNKVAYALEKEFIYQAYVTVKRLQEILLESNIEIELTTYYRILRKALQSAKVDFIGEPLAGLQVMGALETRGLDFKNLVITSMNEGVFPKRGAALSFIPYNLRKAFSLPTYEHQDAVYAYYFYRLLQRAENVALFYDSSIEGVTGGEKSRFIFQLMYASPLKLTLENIDYNIAGEKVLPILIKGNQLIKQKLSEYLEGAGTQKYLSPSAINYFKNCSLRFYFRYIIGLDEPEEVMEEIDAAMFGSILHKAMQELYEPFGNRVISRENLEELIRKQDGISSAINRAFAHEYFKDTDENKVKYEGRNIIIKEVIRKYMVQIIKNDIKHTPFKVHSLENKFETQVPLFQNKMKVRVGGKIDRVDEVGEKYRITDYKTGTIHNTFDEVENLFIPSPKGGLDAVMQIMIYSYLFKKNHDTNYSIIPVLVYLKELFKDEYVPSVLRKTGNRKKEVVDSFEDFEEDVQTKLITLLEMLFSDDVVFKQTDDLDYCSFCAYRSICKR